MAQVRELADFIWSVADLLRGDYKPSDYGKVILPFTVLRRLDCVLEPSKDTILANLKSVQKMDPESADLYLNRLIKLNFHNKSKFTFQKFLSDGDHISENVTAYINGFSKDARDIIDYFEFNEQITRLEKANLLFQVVSRFAAIDLHPEKVSNIEMGYIFEELIRKFADASNETAGEHFTPREVIRLMVNVLFINDRDVLTKKGIIKTLYDPACGTGGMLSIAEEYLRDLNPQAELKVFGQELNPESFAICKSDMMIKAQVASNIKVGNSFTQDGLASEKFDYMLSNPPFGVEWKKVQREIDAEHENLGMDGRFGAGLPRISDGSFLFLQHMISKMKSGNEGSRIGIVFNGSPLFTGGAGSGESDIRKWIIEHDWLEAIIAMPDKLFYNTGISTYVWIVTNRKHTERKGKIQLINAVEFFDKMRKSLGDKSHEISAKHIEEITKIYGSFKPGEHCKIFDNEDFGYRYLTVERPLLENGKVVKDKTGKPKADASLRDNESVPLKEDWKEYVKREVLPHVPDAWVDESKTKIGYEINFTKHFYRFKPLRSLEEIRRDILALEEETEDMIKKVVK
ncbi:SAM-dependent DNA methyltransferase [Candidatus Woesearchaeota archaeon]|nr:SAM-dependent DNA methyltransferase [Candidatus Woesearchaeota archaeon]